MKPSTSQTIEQVLFERMGMTVEDAIATGADVVDDAVARSIDSGIEVDNRIAGLAELIRKLTEPSTLAALAQLLDSLPSLTKLAKLADDLPNVLATMGDVLDEYQQHGLKEGIDVEKALTSGLQTMLYLGSQVDADRLCRIGDLLASDILSPHALAAVDNASKSLRSAQEVVCGSSAVRVGLLGLLRALRDPPIQRSLAFAVQFGRCFGRNIDSTESSTP